jgi:pSer/pThr/pTyr-binding forkhead associated (FHA) protein
MPECVEVELERKLCLYQTFLKLYEHHSSLLDEILGIETFHSSSNLGIKSLYLQGVIDSSSVHVTTNLCQGKTVSLRQPQNYWTLGRDKNSGIYLADSYISRSHAAIYNEEHKFYLIDFNSTNGSYVNGERIFKSVELKDGDRIRLGSTIFDFFLSETANVLPAVTLEQTMLIVQSAEELTNTDNLYKQPSFISELEANKHAGCVDNIFPAQIKSHQPSSNLLHFEPSQEIVDYFLSKSI